MYRSNFIFCFLAFCIFLFSCYDTNNTFGEKLVTSAIRSVVIDTSTVLVTSVVIDSLETSEKGVALVGHYTHPIWGTVSAHSYVAFSPPASYSTNVDAKVILDSLMLELDYQGYFIGDTLFQQQFNVYQLTEKIALNDNGYLYNTNTVAYNPDRIGTTTFWPKPTRNEKVEIRLPDELGEDLLERIHNRDQSVSEDRFEDIFKGIMIEAENSINPALFAFGVNDTSACMKIYYHIRDELENSQEVILSPKSSTQFNHFAHDRSGTLLEPYVEKNVEVASALLGNRGFLFGGIGWYARLEFPYLNNLMQQGEEIAIEQAYLKISPQPDTYSNFNALPDSIFLYIIDENNVVTDAVTDYLGEQVQSATLIEDDTFRENTYYYFDVTSFMQQELGAFGMYKHSLQLVFSSNDYTNTFRNLTFSDQNGSSPITLQIIYKIYESY